MSARLNKLREERGVNTDAQDAILAKVDTEKRVQLDPTETQALKDLNEKLKAIDERIEFEMKVEEHKAANAKPLNVAGQERRVPAEPRRRTYGKTLKAFTEKTYGSVVDAEEAAYRSGQWCRAVVFGDEKAAQWCAENGVQVTRGQVEGTNSAGGYLVFPEMETAIIDLREQYGVFRQNVKVNQMASDSQLIPRRLTGLTASFAAEANAFTESEKTWGNVRLTAQSLGVLTRISRELADDAVISVADDIASEMAYALAVKEDSVGWNGAGLASDGGIYGVRTRIIDGTHTAAAIDAASGHDTFAEYDAPDLVKVIGTLPKYAEANAKWYGSQPAWANTMLRLAAAAGGNTIDQFLNTGKPRRSYLGYEFVTDQTLPTALSDLSDTAVMFFGDLASAVTMGERKGIMIDVSRERYFLERQIAIMGWERIDIVAHSLGDNTTPGPIIALVAE
jgi:HK97 family phage major capsid protein